MRCGVVCYFVHHKKKSVMMQIGRLFLSINCYKDKQSKRFSRKNLLSFSLFSQIHKKYVCVWRGEGGMRVKDSYILFQNVTNQSWFLAIFHIFQVHSERGSKDSLLTMNKMKTPKFVHHTVWQTSIIFNSMKWTFTEINLLSLFGTLCKVW